MSGRRLTPQPDAEGKGGAGPAGPGADIELFARTLWSEAAGESLRGVEAVAAVVMNRAATLTEGRSTMPAGALPAGALTIPIWHGSPV
jgi:N-acetylmuramoyl-L-alanine amidase